MRSTVIALRAWATAALAAALILPAAAQADAIPAAGSPTPPAPQQSSSLAGYEQLGCHATGYPVYREIQGTITAPATSNLGAAGISDDIMNIGGFPGGVSAGLAVNNYGVQVSYQPYGQWGSSGGHVLAPLTVLPGDTLQVTVKHESSGWLVKIFDKTSGRSWSQVKPDLGDHPCQAGAYEELEYPVYNRLTQTTPVAFDSTRVWWAERAGSGVGKLLGTPPAGASLHRYTLVDRHGATIAATSKPADSDNDFTVTDAVPTVYTPTLAGYEVAQSQSQGYPYTGVRATWRVPKITKTSPDSAAIASYFVGIGNMNGNGLMAGVEETMVNGTISYEAFAMFDGRLHDVTAVSPGDTVEASITGSDAQSWSLQVTDEKTGHGGGVETLVSDVSQYDAEVVEWRMPNPLGPGYVPLAATAPATFDHATFTNAGDKTYSFETVLRGGTLQRLVMQNDSGTKIIAATSQPDSDKDGFTVRDGATAPAPPKS